MDVLSFLVSLIPIGAAVGAIVVSRITRRALQPSVKEVKAAEAAAADVLAMVIENSSGDQSYVAGAGRRAAIPTTAELEARRVLIDYAEDLLDEAARIARRAGADAASMVHVRLAADRLGILRQRASVIADIWLALGGLALGAASAFGVNLVTGGTAADGTTGWAIGVGAAGLTLFVIGATTKWIRR